MSETIMSGGMIGNAEGVALERLDTPCLVLDATRMERNIARLRQGMTRLAVGLRPHLKTAKSVEVARLVRSEVRRYITLRAKRPATTLACSRSSNCAVKRKRRWGPGST